MQVLRPEVRVACAETGVLAVRGRLGTKPFAVWPPLTEQEEHTFRAVGRVHRDDFHDLFGGTCRVGVALLRLPDDSGR